MSSEISTLPVPQMEQPASSPAVVDRPNLYELHAREKAGLPQEWRLYKWELFPKAGPDFLYVQITGAVALTKYTKGPRKGRTNWSQKSCQKTVILVRQEHEEWCREWERKTGKCQRCYGTGQSWAGWNHLTGDAWRDCRKCNATGKAPSDPSGNEEHLAAPGSSKSVSSFSERGSAA
jgi:hypothetical protein